MYEQLDLFGFAPSQYIIKKPIRLIELFAGIGAQSKALEVLKANFESYKIAEWSKESIKAYTYIHHYEEIKNCNDKEITNLDGISRNYNEPMTKEQINNLKDDEKILLTNCKKISHNLIDISKVKGEDLNIVDTDKYEYILTYSYPCQDLSLSGKLGGMEEDSGTRSSLLWEVERLLKECKNKPQILLMENVPQVIGTKNKSSFHKFMKRLEVLGYKNFVKVLNAKDFYIPQNRQRCFMVSILTKEDVFSFPNKMKLDYYLLDFLDKEVDEKYYLSDKMIDYIANDNQKRTGNNNKSLINKTIASTINTKEGSRRCDASNYIAPNLPQNFDLKVNKRLTETLNKIDNINKIPLFLDTYNQKAHSKIVGTITTRVSASNNSFLLVPENTKKGYAEEKVGDGVYINRPQQKRGVVQKGMIQTIKTSCDDIDVVVIGEIVEKKSNNGTQWFLQDRVYDNKISPAICTSFNPYFLTKHLRIRKLTPCECYKLMGFTQIDYEKCAKIQSNATIYHQAGDSIVVTVLIAIFGKLLGIDYEKVIKEYVKGEILNESEYNI